MYFSGGGDKKWKLTTVLLFMCAPLFFKLVFYVFLGEILYNMTFHKSTTSSNSGHQH